MAWKLLILAASLAAFSTASAADIPDDSLAEESSIAEILAKLSDPDNIADLSAELLSSNTQLETLDSSVTDQSGEDTRLRAELLALGYVPGSTTERLKISEGLDELDKLILRGQRLRSETKSAESDEKLNKLLSRRPQLLGLTQTSRQPKRLRGNGKRKRVRKGPKSQRQVVVRGRDPRPVAIAPSGVGVVGTVAGVIEEDEDVVYEYEYEDYDYLEYDEYRDYETVTLKDKRPVLHKKKLYSHTTPHTYHAKHTPYTPSHHAYNHHSNGYYHKPAPSAPSYGGPYAKDPYDYPSQYSGYVPHSEPAPHHPPPPPPPPQQHKKAYEYYVHVKGQGAEPLHDPYRKESPYHHSAYPEPVYHKEPYHEYHHEKPYEPVYHHEPVYHDKPYHHDPYAAEPYHEPLPEGYYYKDSAPKDPYYKDSYGEPYHSKYGKSYEPSYPPVYDHHSSYPSSKPYVPEYRSEPVYREHVVPPHPAPPPPVPVHHPAPVHHPQPHGHHEPGFSHVLEVDGHHREPPLEILEEEPPVLLPEGHAVVEAAPVEGEAYGEDLVGDFHHHTGPFGAFGFYANFFDDGRRVTIGRHPPPTYYRRPY